MRLSPVYCSVVKFLKHRDFIFTDKKFAKKAFFKIHFALVGGLIPAVYWITEFAMPTPDVAYDVKRWVYPEFEAYVVSKGLGSHDPQHDAAVRSFRYFHKSAEERKQRDQSHVTIAS